MAQNSGPAAQEAASKTTYPSWEKLEARLQEWQHRNPRIMELETLARSAEGRPIYSARLTDPAVDDDDKQHTLLTCLHSGIERSGSLGLFAVMKWLLSEDAVAREILQRQVLVCMPVVNPDGYVAGTFGNTKGKVPYQGFTLDGPNDPEDHPEGVAVQKVMEEYQPEVHADLHGLDMTFGNYIMLESSGAAYSNLALRPYHHVIMDLMDEAALEEGFPSDKLEQDAEQLFWGPGLDAISYKLWRGRPRPYAAVYCYSRYHTMVFASEVLWPRSALLRHRRLLQVGNEVWPGEYYPGYPTNVVISNGLYAVVAYGETASQRRRSRVELWSKQRQIVHGFNNPQVEGLVVYVCATSPAAAKRWLADPSIKGFAANIGEHPAVNGDAIRRVLKDHPDGPGQWGPRAALALEGGGADASTPIENGIALRVRIPYPKVRLTDLRLNGHPVRQSESDGYITWNARGFTYVQVNVPPEKSKTEDLFAITCQYEPDVDRSKFTMGLEDW